MNQSNKIPARCLPLRWWGAALVQAETGAPLVAAQFKGGRDPVVAGGERLVGSTESSLRECNNPCFSGGLEVKQVTISSTGVRHFTSLQGAF